MYVKAQNIPYNKKDGCNNWKLPSEFVGMNLFSI